MHLVCLCYIRLTSSLPLTVLVNDRYLPLITDEVDVTRAMVAQVYNRKSSGNHLNINFSSYKQIDFEDKTVSRPSYLLDGNTKTGKTVYILRLDLIRSKDSQQIYSRMRTTGKMLCNKARHIKSPRSPTVSSAARSHSGCVLRQGMHAIDPVPFIP